MTLLSGPTLHYPVTGERFVSVRDFGAVGDGVVDDTTAINTALAASASVYFPSGTYKVTSALTVTSGAVLYGNGINSELQYSGTSTLFTLTSLQDVTFTGLSIYLSGAGATAISLSGCFLIQIDRVRIRGAHTDKTVTTYRGQVGLLLTSNTGNTRIHSTHFANLGAGIKTSCIQNEVTNSRFTNCYYSVWGTGNSGNAGLVAVACEFIGTGSSPFSTLYHVWIDGSANTWSFTGCWFEGADYGLVIGDSTNGGPSSLWFCGNKIAARTVGIQVNYVRQPHFEGNEFNLDSGGTMTEITFPGAGLNYEGVFFNNVTTLRSDFADSDIPQYFNVARRGSFRVPNFLSSSNLTVSGTTSTGNLAVTNSVTNGYVLKSDASGNATWQPPVQMPTASKTANYTAVAGDLVLCNAGSGAFTVTLPTTPLNGTRILVFKSDTSQNALTITAGGADLINATGTTSIKLTSQYAVAYLEYSLATTTWYNLEAGAPCKFSWAVQSSTRATGYGDLPEGPYFDQAASIWVRWRSGTADASGSNTVALYSNTSNTATGTAVTSGSTTLTATSAGATTSWIGPFTIAAGTYVQTNVTALGTTPGARLYMDVTGVYL